MIALLLACGPAPAPLPGVRLDRAVALDRERAWVDLVDDEGRAARCLVVEDRQERCVPRTPGPSALQRLGDRLVEPRVSSASTPATRRLALVDPDSGEETRTIDLGYDLRQQVSGDGTLMVGPDGLLLAVANRGIGGAPAFVVDGGPVEALAAYAIEAWGDELVWRRAVLGVPDEAWVQGDRVLVHGGPAWRVLDARTGATVAEVPGVAGACVGEGRLWTVAGDVILEVDLGSGAVTKEPFAPPGWIASCVVHEGRPVFHGGLPDARGWLVGPAFARMDVPRVDLRLQDHVSAAGRWWVMEQTRGLAIVDPRTRAVTREDRAHNVVGGVVWFEITPDRSLRMTLHTDVAEAVLAARLSPTLDHVVDGVLWTFPLRAPLGEPLSARLSLPALEGR